MIHCLNGVVSLVFCRLMGMINFPDLYQHFLLKAENMASSYYLRIKDTETMRTEKTGVLYVLI